MSIDRFRALVIDDEREVLRLLKKSLCGMGFEVVAAESGPAGIACYSREAFDIVLVDLRMSGMDGIEVIRRLKALDADVMAVVMTAYGSIDTAVQAMKTGATDYLTKPLDLHHLEIILMKALETRRQSEELRLLREQVVHRGSFEGLVGVSSAMQRVYRVIRQVAGSGATVLIYGETGTGKELVARAIHNLSGRGQKGGFMPISCGALSETILESELFGHEKGAFTGADRRKYGLIEQAAEGTLFLDEIEAMSAALQVKLLRAIQEREVLRVGGEQPVPVDFRLVAATNADLRERMEQGVFRADLFYRLNVVSVDLPPLRARKEDIPLLASHFVAVHAGREGRPIQEIVPEALMLLKVYAWPGNVRELENVIEQAVLLCHGEQITVEDLPKHLQVSASGLEAGEDFDHIPLREARARFESQYLERALVRAAGNVTEAARRAGISLRHFYEKMKRYGISR